MQGDDNQELSKKLDKNDSFSREMQAVARKFKQLEQHIYYSPQNVHPALIIHIDAANEFTGTHIRHREYLYIINGQYQPTGEQSYQRFLLQLVQTLPHPTSAYGFIYVNTLAESNAYGDFRKALQALPSDYLLHLTKIYVIQASFFSRALTFLSFGTVTNYLKNKTVNVETLSQLCRQARVDTQMMLKILPKNVVAVLVKVEEQANRKNLRTEQDIELNAPLHRAKSELICPYSPIAFDQIKEPPASSRKQISDYEVGPSGAPIILQMLIYFFSNSDQGLKEQGLFRKSVAIDQQRNLIRQLNNQDYNCLANVQDPHLIANGIKRFISGFRQPVIPYKTFDMLMEADQQDEHFGDLVVESVKQLPKVNRMVLFFLLDFLRNRMLPFASHNLMTENNLCIVFGPCLMRAQVPSIKELIYAKKVVIVMRELFKQFQAIFGDEGEQSNMRRNSYEQYMKEHQRHKRDLQQKQHEKRHQMENEKEKQTEKQSNKQGEIIQNQEHVNETVQE